MGHLPSKQVLLQRACRTWRIGSSLAGGRPTEFPGVARFSAGTFGFFTGSTRILDGLYKGVYKARVRPLCGLSQGMYKDSRLVFVFYTGLEYSV